MSKRAYRTAKSSIPQNRVRQSRKSTAVIPDDQKHITVLQRIDLQTMVLWLKDQRPGGYRWLARHTPRGATAFGWWQRVATGKRDVKPARADLEAVRRLYDLMQEEHDIDEQVLTLLLDIIEHRGAMDAALSKLIRLIRGKAAS